MKSHKEVKKEALKDPVVKEEYDNLEGEFKERREAIIKESELPSKCKLCGGSKEVLRTKARQMGYTIAPSEPPDVLEEKLIPCPLCSPQPQEGLTEDMAIALFEREIEKGQQWAKEDGLDKIGMMPHETKWEELAEKDKRYWVEWAEELQAILRTLSYSFPQEAKDKDLISIILPHIVDSKTRARVLGRLGQLVKEKVEQARGTNTKIVCLCGSTRFTDIMLVKQWELTKQGCIVLSWCALPSGYFEGEDKTHVGDREGVKELVDEVHKRKIDLSDEVFVINKGGYIGESTRSEIDYAVAHNKPVNYMEALKGGTE